MPSGTNSSPASWMQKHAYQETSSSKFKRSRMDIVVSYYSAFRAHFMGGLSVLEKGVAVTIRSRFVFPLKCRKSNSVHANCLSANRVFRLELARKLTPKRRLKCKTRNQNNYFRANCIRDRPDTDDPDPVSELKRANIPHTQKTRNHGVARRLCLPAQQAPERVAMPQAHERFRRPCAALGGGVVAARSLPPRTVPRCVCWPVRK
jgi:hypothetical protein